MSWLEWVWAGRLRELAGIGYDCHPTAWWFGHCPPCRGGLFLDQPPPDWLSPITSEELEQHTLRFERIASRLRPPASISTPPDPDHPALRNAPVEPHRPAPSPSAE